MAKTSLPPGFRFHPTDVELVRYYLKRKVMGEPLRCEVIAEIELYKFSPWDLPDKSCLQSKDREWYFFCSRDRKYANGSRASRTTDIGYWKTTGKDRSVIHNSQTVGMKKTLVFHNGKAPRGDRTDWVMYEYRLADKELVNLGFSQDAFVLCKIFQKSGPGPKNGEQYGAPFKEEDWEDDEVNDHEVSIPCVTYPCPRPLEEQAILLAPVLHPSVTSGVDKLPSTPHFLEVDGLLEQLAEDLNGSSRVSENTNCKDTLALCKIFKKSVPAPKNGKKKGTLPGEEGWENEEINDRLVSTPCMSCPSPGPLDDQSILLEPALQQSVTSGVDKGPSTPDLVDVDELMKLLAEDLNGFSHSTENADCKVSASVSWHRTTNDISAVDIQETYDLEDLFGKAELEPIDRIYLSNNMDSEAVLQPMLSDSWGESFMELNDFHFPWEKDHIEFGMPSDLFAHSPGFQNWSNVLGQTISADNCVTTSSMVSNFLPRGSGVFDDPLALVPRIEFGIPSDLFSPSPGFQNLSNVVGQTFSADNHVTTSSMVSNFLPRGSAIFDDHSALVREMNDSRRNTNWWYEEEMHPRCIALEAGQDGSKYCLQEVAGGEQHKASANSEYFFSNKEEPRSKLHYLLGSITARPASAAEYACPLKGCNSKGGISFCSSSIHVKAEVTFQHDECTKDGFTNKMGRCHSMYCQYVTLSRRFTRETPSSGGGFMFVFFLGVISALIWIFLFTMVVKLGKGAWKLMS